MTADTVGGIATYVADLTAALDAEVDVATMGPGTPYRLEWEDDPWEDVDRAGAWLLELEDELRPDLVHLNGFAHGCLPWRAPVVIVAHSDVFSWWWAVHGTNPPESYDRYHATAEAGLRAADAVVAPTESALRDLERHYRFRGRRKVVHNGSAFVPAQAEKEPFVVALGRFWDGAKNIELLERVREGAGWPIVTAGDGTARGRLSRDEVRLLLARASVFASPALYEPFGLGALEAGLSGCALVLSDIPSFREVWGDAAFFAPPDDDDAFAAALRLLARDDEVRLELGERARRRASRYTVERMAAGYQAVYESVMERAPA